MKYLMILIFAMTICAMAEPKILDYKLPVNIAAAIKTSKGIFIAGREMVAGADYAPFYKFNENNFTFEKLELPEGDDYKIKYKDVKFGTDNEGNLYVLADKVYKYDGSSWKYYFIDDKYKNDRDFNAMAVSNDGKIVITASAAIATNPERPDLKNEHKSNLLLLENEQLIELETSDNVWDYSNLIFIQFTPSGKLLRNHVFSKGKPEIYEDFYIYDKDLNFNSAKKEVIVPPNLIEQIDYTGLNRYLKFIYPISDETFYLGLNVSQFTDGAFVEGTFLYSCCNGVTKYQNGKWHPMGPENGFPMFNSGLLPTPFSMLKIDENRSLLLGSPKFYTIDHSLSKDYFEAIDLNAFYNQTLIFDNTYESSSKAIHRKLDRLFEGEDPSATAGFVTMFFDDNKLWYVNQQGIYIFDMKTIVSSVESMSNDYKVFPNPANEFINIVSGHLYNNYEIIDAVGNTLKVGSIEGANTRVELSQFSAGVYFIKLIGNDNLSVSKFVKH